jgi:hypothetical protein
MNFIKRHKLLTVITFVVVFIIALIIGVSVSASKPLNYAANSPSTPAATQAPATHAPVAQAPTTQAPPSLTVAEQQAVESAQSYLSDGQGFSEQGLLNQLTSSYGEGDTTADAKFAISYLHPDWDAQAVESAKGYLSDGQGFSRAGLIQQLTSSYGEGFTYAQAVYAVNQAGL